MPSPNGHAPSFRWGLYVRVSSAEQAGPDAASIEVQLRDTAQLVEREGGELVDTYCDDKAYRVEGRLVEPSGERADRPEFQRLLADISAGRINAVACYHEWRLYRDYPPFTQFIMTVRGRGVTVKLVHGYWVEQFAVFGAWQGKSDNLHRTAQTSKGNRSKAERGYSPTKTPRFYATTRNERGRRTAVTLRPEYREWLDRAASLFVAGASYLDIAVSLSPDPVTGRPVLLAGVIEIFSNVFNRGYVDIAKRSVKGAARQVVRGVHPPAWDAPTCAAIEAELARRAALGRSVPHGARHLFAGLVRCGYCGGLMSGHGFQAGRRSTSYQCTHSYRARKGYGPHKPHPANVVSEYKLLALLRQIGQTATPERVAALLANARVQPAAGKSPSEAVLATARNRLAEVEAELEAATGKVSRRLLEAEAERAQRELARLQQSSLPPGDALPPVDPAELLAFFSHVDTLCADPERLRAELLRVHFPPLYIKHGVLCHPPELP